jgi:hypothetical protein
MIRGSPRRLRVDPAAETQLAEIKLVDKDVNHTIRNENRFKQRLNSGRLSDPFFLQDLQFLLAWPDGQSISDEALEFHQSSLLTNRKMSGVSNLL